LRRNTVNRVFLAVTLQGLGKKVDASNWRQMGTGTTQFKGDKLAKKKKKTSKLENCQGRGEENKGDCGQESLKVYRARGDGGGNRVFLAVTVQGNRRLMRVKGLGKTEISQGAPRQENNASREHIIQRSKEGTLAGVRGPIKVKKGWRRDST
jgi:hypothetical protein